MPLQMLLALLQAAMLQQMRAQLQMVQMELQ